MLTLLRLLIKLFTVVIFSCKFIESIRDSPLSKAIVIFAYLIDCTGKWFKLVDSSFLVICSLRSGSGAFMNHKLIILLFIRCYLYNSCKIVRCMWSSTERFPIFWRSHSGWRCSGGHIGFWFLLKLVARSIRPLWDLLLTQVALWTGC
jgi:hypothetical protein